MTKILKKISTIYNVAGVVVNNCIGCSLCVDNCPTCSIEMVDGKAVIHTDGCIDCYMCNDICPVGAIIEL